MFLKFFQNLQQDTCVGRNLFLINLHVSASKLYLKRGFDTCVCLWIFRNFNNTFTTRHLRANSCYKKNSTKNEKNEKFLKRMLRKQEINYINTVITAFSICARKYCPKSKYRSIIIFYCTDMLKTYQRETKTHDFHKIWLG